MARQAVSRALSNKMAVEAILKQVRWVAMPDVGAMRNCSGCLNKRFIALAKTFASSRASASGGATLVKCFL